ncbi:MAG: RNA polymerase factor sigma-54 [Planctomycetes bacterium]|nr:RNA polymerase factor sigma-54 [Planctomycetota bacterium]
MANTPRMGVFQQQQMRQTMLNVPQMIQTQEMLQLPLMALEQRVRQELLENPALEMVELENDYSEDNDYSEENRIEDSEETELQDQLTEETFSVVDDSDYSLQDIYDEAAPRGRYRGGDDDEYNGIDNAAAPGESLQQHLASQLAYLQIPPRQRELCERIIYSLEDDGYLRIPLEELPYEDEEFPPTVTELQEALRIVQKLDPPGIGAASLKECLLLQIKAMTGYEKGYHDFEYKLIEQHLDDIAANRLPKVARAMGATLDEIKEALEFIRTLKPSPGLEFGQLDELPIVPDIVIRLEKGEFIISLNHGNLPELRVSASYRDAIKAKKQPAETKKYLRERLVNADWIIYAIQQRKRTLMNVTRSIVEHQKDFLIGTVDRPGPLMMQTVSDDVGIDISTVSRAVKDKYAQTPRGVIALREMFTRQMSRANEEMGSTSNVQIMGRIKELIENEDPRAPLKDAQIVKLLKAEGIEIVRRTVAKYRGNLGLLSYSQRKQH